MTRPWLLRRVVGDARRHGGVWLALAVAFASVGFCVAAAWLASRPAARDAVSVTSEPVSRVVAYLKDDVTAAESADLQRVLAKLPGVEEVLAVSAKEGLERLRRELGPRAALLEGVGPDLLFPSLEIAARPAALASALAFRLRRLRGISDVDLVTAPPASTLAGAWAMAGPQGLLSSRAVRASVGGVSTIGTFGGGLAALLALGAALALLRVRFRAELRVLLTLGLSRATSARPALTLATGVGGLGAVAGLLAASGAARAWPGGAGLSVREAALGTTALVILAFLSAFVALRAPEAARAR